MDKLSEAEFDDIMYPGSAIQLQETPEEVERAFEEAKSADGWTPDWDPASWPTRAWDAVSPLEKMASVKKQVAGLLTPEQHEQEDQIQRLRTQQLQIEQQLKEKQEELRMKSEQARKHAEDLRRVPPPFQQRNLSAKVELEERLRRHTHDMPPGQTVLQVPDYEIVESAPPSLDVEQESSPPIKPKPFLERNLSSKERLEDRLHRHTQDVQPESSDASASGQKGMKKTQSSVRFDLPAEDSIQENDVAKGTFDTSGALPRVGSNGSGLDGMSRVSSGTRESWFRQDPDPRIPEWFSPAPYFQSMLPSWGSAPPKAENSLANADQTSPMPSEPPSPKIPETELPPFPEPLRPPRDPFTMTDLLKRDTSNERKIGMRQLAAEHQAEQAGQPIARNDLGLPDTFGSESQSSNRRASDLVSNAGTETDEMLPSPTMPSPSLSPQPSPIFTPPPAPVQPPPPAKTKTLAAPKQPFLERNISSKERLEDRLHRHTRDVQPGSQSADQSPPERAGPQTES